MAIVWQTGVRLDTTGAGEKGRVRVASRCETPTCERSMHAYELAGPKKGLGQWICTRYLAAHQSAELSKLIDWSSLWMCTNLGSNFAKALGAIGNWVRQLPPGNLVVVGESSILRLSRPCQRCTVKAIATKYSPQRWSVPLPASSTPRCIYCACLQVDLITLCWHRWLQVAAHTNNFPYSLASLPSPERSIPKLDREWLDPQTWVTWTSGHEAM